MIHDKEKRPEQGNISYFYFPPPLNFIWNPRFSCLLLPTSSSGAHKPIGYVHLQLSNLVGPMGISGKHLL